MRIRTRKTKLKARIEQYPGRLYQLAGETAIHPTTIGEYANDRKTIPQGHLKALAEALGCKPKDLLGYAE